MSTLSIRLPNSIHQHAKRLARDEGVSVNQLGSSALAEKLSALDAILAKIPLIEPEPHDRISRMTARKL